MTDIISKDQPFYLPLSQHPPTPAFRSVLENYSKIAPSDLNSHLEAVVCTPIALLFPLLWRSIPDCDHDRTLA